MTLDTLRAAGVRVDVAHGPRGVVLVAHGERWAVHARGDDVPSALARLHDCLGDDATLARNAEPEGIRTGYEISAIPVNNSGLISFSTG